MELMETCEPLEDDLAGVLIDIQTTHDFTRNLARRGRFSNLSAVSTTCCCCGALRLSAFWLLHCHNATPCQIVK